MIGRYIGMKAIGIDLGTTYSCVAVYQNEKVDIIPNELGNSTTPSYVSFTNCERLIGDPAKQLAAINTQNTIYDIKRIIGRRFTDNEVQNDISQYPFKIISVDDNPCVQVSFMNQVNIFTPEQISSFILQKLSSNAEDYLGYRPKEVVITVPAYFTDAQRNSTITASKIAGLNCLRIINEPTAACIAYGFQRSSSKDQKIVVYDFGGGTLDCSLINLSDGVFEVIGTSGDSRLGGEDIDQKLVDFVNKEFTAKHNYSLLHNNRTQRRIRNQCEKVKRLLSNQEVATIEIENIDNDIHFQLQLTRAKFNSICSDIFRRAILPLQKLLKDANCNVTNINEVVLVGGSTRIYQIRESLKQYFKGKEPSKSINPDEAVAYGAAIQAGILSSCALQKIGTGQILLIDVCPLSLGIEVVGGQMATIIARNTTIPVLKRKLFTTEYDNQTEINVKIFEGERELTKFNNLLGEFQLSGIPVLPKGKPAVEVSCEITANGLLIVSAKDLTGSKSKNSISIDQNRQKLSDKQVEYMVQEAEKFREYDETIKKLFAIKNEIEEYIYCIKQNNNLNQKEPIKQIEEWLEDTNIQNLSIKQITDKFAQIKQQLQE
ncbi:Cytosolic heat shock protein 70 [Spironucleus salmonicida]|uniref:Cytosolic HSP70 n=1 Tax=Spironucleus salmonicida TaxID=348837 RepID=V6LE99_9EUKA|nr:Cytosolic heat shock protein 70 [Spironucleus salmonicida]|eukprot:EST42021.1 Cytosolic HSP70 [Spironucleus salmonicida]